jgi:hypothetical protein
MMDIGQTLLQAFCRVIIFITTHYNVDFPHGDFGDRVAIP